MHRMMKNSTEAGLEPMNRDAVGKSSQVSGQGKDTARLTFTQVEVRSPGKVMSGQRTV